MTEILKRSGNQLKRHTSTNLINSRTLQQIYSPPHSRVTKYTQIPIVSHQNPKSIIENLFKGENLTSLKKISARVQMKNRKNILVETEQRIISEVIGLVREIDELRQKITVTNSQIVELQIAHPDIQEKVRFYGYDQRLTAQQCAEIQSENDKLAAFIRESEEKQASGLEEVLIIERQNYEVLKRQLAEGKPSDSKDLDQRIKTLKIQIQTLEGVRKVKIKASYPQFQELNKQNQALRQKTITMLMQSKQMHEEQFLLREYLTNDEISRQEFMRQLQVFKTEYNRMKAENRKLKQRVFQKQIIQSKENFNTNVFRKSNVKNVDKTIELQNQVKKNRNDKLSQYSSIIKRMQSLQR